MALPNFMIAGAPKCGTTALWEYLNGHHEVFMTSIKEPHFFTEMQKDMGEGMVKIGPERSITYTKGLGWYEHLFREGATKKARGEASTHYFSAPDSAFLIHECLPETKLIFLLRDPVDRAYSHYWQDHKSGWPLPDFTDIITNESSILRYYTYVSSYKVHLERFFSLFPSDQILVLLYEDFRKKPHDIFKIVCDFLQIDDENVTLQIEKDYNPYTIPRFKKVKYLVTYLSHNKIANKMPVSVRGFLRKFKKAIDKSNSIAESYPALSQEIRASLVPQFSSDIQYVESLVNKNLDAWRRC